MTIITDYRLEEQCKHGFETPIVCPICEGRVDTPSNTRDVHVVDNAHAQAYHSRTDCPMLRNAEAPVVRVSEASLTGTHHMCPVCFDKYGNGRPR
ncbi:MAG: hypothetical protein RL383_276 [Actinomycetota bacterium]|jgi:hypothetical protein